MTRMSSIPHSSQLGEPLRGEVARLARLAVPVALSNLGMIAMGWVDQVLLGHYGTSALAAVGLANPWVFGTIMFANGILLGLDPIIARAHGARDGARSARALNGSQAPSYSRNRRVHATSVSVLAMRVALVASPAPTTPSSGAPSRP